MLPRSRRTQIEVAIVEILEDYGVTEYPMSIGRLAAALGIDLVPHSSLDSQTRPLAVSASEDAFSLCSPDYTMARIVFDDRGSYHYRSRFSGGHEIGHIILEHLEGGGVNEEEADYFSGYLLIPHPLVIAMGSDATVASIAERFGISRPCASVALDQAHARRNEGGLWRTHERWLIDNATWKGGGLLARA